MRFDEKICVELDSLREELSKKRQARAAYKVARDLFQGQIAILSKYILNGFIRDFSPILLGL